MFFLRSENFAGCRLATPTKTLCPTGRPLFRRQSSHAGSRHGMIDLRHPSILQGMQRAFCWCRRSTDRYGRFMSLALAIPKWPGKATLRKSYRSAHTVSTILSNQLGSSTARGQAGHAMAARHGGFVRKKVLIRISEFGGDVGCPARHARTRVRRGSRQDAGQAP